MYTCTERLQVKVRDACETDKIRALQACELTDADNAASDAEAGRSTRRLSARAEIQSAAADADASTASPKRRGQKRKAPFDRSAS
eukprot:6189092-Pleurochrysis_carterae.AAC.10